MKKKTTSCKSVFKTGDETTKEAFTYAMARVIERIENDRPPKGEESKERDNKRSDT